MELPMYVNGQSILRSYVYLGQFTGTEPQVAGLGTPEVKTYDLYMTLPPSATSPEEVSIYARFGDGYADKLMGNLKSNHTQIVRSPLGEAAKRAFKHIFERGMKS